MKNKALTLPLLAVLSTAPYAHALELKVVKHYDNAEASSLWEKTKADQVPTALLSQESLAKPSSSYGGLFPKTFFQEEMFVVCYQDCKKDSFKETKGEISDLNNWNVVEQSNVYFWLNRYFSFLDEELLYQPKKFLKVMTNRDFREDGKQLKNNAFFNPMDISLSFLPANKNILFKLLSGKINRSGFDPSVIVHEASHYLFHHLFPNPVNSEIGGLNEGFADYIANAFLNNPKVGLIMLQGKALRDSSSLVDSNLKIKTYEPKLEVHDMGERISYALWEARKLATDKTELDRLVIDAISDLGQNPYATIHDFKEKMLVRLPQVISPVDMNGLLTKWEIVFPGKSSKISNFSFLNGPIASKSYTGFSIKQTISKEMAGQMGIPTDHHLSFTYLKEVKLSATQHAVLITNETETLTTPYWTVIDTERSNVLGIYSMNGDLITDEKEVELVQRVASQAAGASEFIKDFNDKLSTFINLSNGKGALSIGYKVKSKKMKEESIVFNGSPINGQRLDVELKRKMIIGRLLGFPEIKSVSLLTVPVDGASSITLEDQSVIGYRLKLKSGMTTEVMLHQISL